MISQKFVDKIQDLRSHTYSNILHIQHNTCPMLYDIKLSHTNFYRYEGYEYEILEQNAHLYLARGVPYCYYDALKNIQAKKIDDPELFNNSDNIINDCGLRFKDTLDNLIAEGKVWPFLFFINGLAVPWSKITIIKDYNDSYIKISGDMDQIYSNSTTVVLFPLLPSEIRYGEDGDILLSTNRKGFYFDASGRRVEDPDFAEVALRLEILSDNIYYKETNLALAETRFLEFTGLPDGHIPTLDNIIAFDQDGLFDDVKESKKVRDTYKSSYGIFTIHKPLKKTKWAILLYNTASPKMASYLYSKPVVNKTAVTKLLKDNVLDTESEIWADIINPLINVFDFSADSQKSMSDAAKYITRYDFNLWKDTFASDLDMKFINYTGAEFKSLATNNVIRYSRNHSDRVEDYVLIFVNNKLYKHIQNVSYVADTINIPVADIADDDRVELILYTNVNNKVLSVLVPDANTDVYIHPEYAPENCDMMSETCPDAVYTVVSRSDGRKQYIVDYTYTVDNSNRYKITFANPYYYGKQLWLAPKNQFRYCRITSFLYKAYAMLPTDFNYCHNPNQYLVFVNGRKIDRSEYTITIMNENRPFDALVIYISTMIDSGDYVDVFYVPEEMIERYDQNAILNNGLLMLEDTETSINYPTTYPLSKDTCMVFVNGLKVNRVNIKDISLNTLLIDVDKYQRYEDGTIKRDASGNPLTKPYYVSSVNNVTVIGFVPGNKEIAGYLEGLYEQIPEGSEYDPSLIDFNKSAADSWKKLIKMLLTKYAEEGSPYAGISKIFGRFFDIEDPDPNYKNYYADLKSILYDILIDYYLTSKEATTGNKFVYDFEREALGLTDNSIDINLVPNKDKLFDYNSYDNIATTEDVLLGKKFEAYDNDE